MTRFDRDTALRAAGPGVFEGSIDPGWWITHGPNGGYVAAIVLRAMTMTLDDTERLPLSLTVHFVRPAREGPVRVTTAVERMGRSVTNLTFRAHQGDDLVVFGTAAFSTPRPEVLTFADLHAPDVPPPEACAKWPPADVPMTVPINGRYDIRWAIGDPPGHSTERLEVGGWVRTEDARPVDHLLAAALADAWVPPVFSRVGLGTVGVPTVELSVYFRDGLPLPAGDYVLGVFRSQVAARGFVEEDGELWSAGGTLVAQSRQISAVVAVPG